ncbi:MAG TPA: XRE family transcriptional regulator [Nitrospirae bacterium]|nr:XRE family transcriptional regulator [Nitrospirota bacterium]HDZ87154.1 XRE family transcriptional regulator [Nitrospirota bacterium]
MRKRSKKRNTSEPGMRIRSARLSKGLSQMKLAERIGISYQQIQKYENGKSQLTLKRLSQISEALNLPLSYFIGDSNGLTVSEPEITYGELNRDELKLIDLLRKINNKKFIQLLIDAVKLLSGLKQG